MGRYQISRSCNMFCWSISFIYCCELAFTPSHYLIALFPYFICERDEASNRDCQGLLHEVKTFYPALVYMATLCSIPAGILSVVIFIFSTNFKDCFRFCQRNYYKELK